MKTWVGAFYTEKQTMPKINNSLKTAIPMNKDFQIPP